MCIHLYILISSLALFYSNFATLYIYECARHSDDWKHGFMEDALDNVNHIFEVVQDTHHADLSIVYDVIELLHMDVNVPKEALEVCIFLF